MAILLAIYFPLLLLVIAYVVINAYHLINFRLPIKGDVAQVMLAIYILVVVSLLAGSVILGLISYYA